MIRQTSDAKVSGLFRPETFFHFDAVCQRFLMSVNRFLNQEMRCWKNAIRRSKRPVGFGVVSYFSVFMFSSVIGLSVSAVARQCGYADESNFVRRFRQQFGMTPLQYRSARSSSALRQDRAAAGSLSAGPDGV